MNKFEYAKELLKKALEEFEGSGDPFLWSDARSSYAIDMLADEVAKQSIDESEIRTECPNCGRTVGCVDEAENCPVCGETVF